MKLRYGVDAKTYEFTRLAMYNGECARGIVHTPEYDAEMAEEQRRFNEASKPPPTEGGEAAQANRERSS